MWNEKTKRPWDDPKHTLLLLQLLYDYESGEINKKNILVGKYLLSLPINLPLI